jgi:uncharacterized protein YjbI with pentapeptide repeats
MTNQHMTLISQTTYTDQVFKGIILDGQQIDTGEFYDCRFIRCTFSESIFRKCRFVNCVFQGCDLSLLQLPASTFSGTRFEDSKIIGVDWTQADWKSTSLGIPLSFYRSTLNHATFIGLNLKGIEIKDCNAANVDFREANLSQADFTGTDLSESLFVNTDLSAADLSQARNYQIAPEQNTIKQTKFSLPEALSLLYNMDIELIED